MRRPIDTVTVGVFEAEDRATAQALAEELTARNHLVFMHEGEDFTSEKLPLRATSWTWSIARGALVVAAIALGVLVAAEAAQLMPLGYELSFARVVGVVGVAALFGGLAAAFSGAMTPARKLEETEKAMSEPGRFALAVTTARARRPFVEARIAQAGAVTVNSV